MIHPINVYKDYINSENFTGFEGTVVDHDSKGASKEEHEMRQQNSDHAKGWQTVVEGGTNYIGEIHFHGTSSQSPSKSTQSPLDVPSLKPQAGEIEVFFSYAYEDEALRDQLAKHLKEMQRQGLIRQWHDRQIGAGKEREGEIDRHLNNAQIILLLVSVDFIASDNRFDKEIKRAMERHQKGEARIIPVILRPVDLKGLPFSQLQALPTNRKPITTWSNQEEAFLDIAKGIRAVVEEITQKP